MPGLLADENADAALHAILNVCHAPAWREFWTALRVHAYEFQATGLRRGTSDRDLWHFCQQRGLLLLTNNRNSTDADSLEAVIRSDGTPQSLPVLTVGSPERVLADRTYAERCAVRLMEIILDLEGMRGSGRLFLP